MNHATKVPIAEVRALREASRSLVRELGCLQAGVGALSTSQCHALVELGGRGPLTGAQLAELLRCDKSTTSRALAPLVRRRLLRAVVPDADRRSKRFELTAAGQKELARAHDQADAQVEAALRLLSPADRDTARAGLSLYARALERARRLASVVLRAIAATDNAAVANVIRTVMPEFGASGPGFAITDPEVDDMHGAYRRKAAYFVAEVDGVVLGGAGVAPLVGGEVGVCELKKMYLMPQARGLGVGQGLLARALAAARKLGYRRCYLETLTHMQQARALYEKHGFRRIDAAMGNTGHFGCNTFYLRDLDGD